MNIRSIRYARSINLGGGDTVRYSASAELMADDQADACAIVLAAQVNGWLHDRLTQHYSGEDMTTGRPRGRDRGSDQT